MSSTPSDQNRAESDQHHMKTTPEYFDRDVLQEAQQVLKNRFPMVLQGYLDDTQGYIDQIAVAIEKNDYQMVFRQAHPLKASSEALGIVRLAKIARALEHAARMTVKEEKSDVENAQQMLESLRQTYISIRPLLLQLLKQS